MKPLRKNSFALAVALLAAVAFAGCSKANQGNQSPSPSFANQGSQAGQPSAPGQPAGASAQSAALTIPAGAELHVVLDQSVSSATAHNGDPFDASLIEPVSVDGVVAIPRDARVKGHIVSARASGRLSGVAQLSLTLDSVEVAGRSYDIQTDTISRRGSSHKKRDVVAIGGGSALGAIIGGIAGGGKGAAIGALAGGGAGTAGAALTGKKNVAVPAEARLSFALAAPLTLSGGR
ncbi:MAG TPA: hypothetical protein VGS20_12170 [Candidatus Acidoferrales bacterium]|nr:hypothetical protein [Candidatus Acidoferrales bacterium]